VTARFLATVEAILEGLVPELREGDAVLVLSNGGFGGIHERLLRALGA
jgi:UDP-N-acetylmuramate: L-alanyl-gamma-D-glutamyl-meso-diaminopimelate ligase